MHVYVISYAGARDVAKIHPHIESFGLIDLDQRLLRSLHQIHHFIGDVFRRRQQLPKM
jgi:hypothetical protein